MCHVSPVTCHVSLMPIATYPHPANSQLNKVGWFEKTQKKFTQQIIETIQFSNISDTLFNQKSPDFLVWGVDGGKKKT